MELALTRSPASPLAPPLADDQRRSASMDCCFLSGRRDAVAGDCCSDSCLIGPPECRFTDMPVLLREHSDGGYEATVTLHTDSLQGFNIFLFANASIPTLRPT